MFRSGSLRVAISCTCALVTEPTLFLLGSPDPLSMPAALRSRPDAGGVLQTKMNVRSEWTVISAAHDAPWFENREGITSIDLSP